MEVSLRTGAVPRLRQREGAAFSTQKEGATIGTQFWSGFVLEKEWERAQSRVYVKSKNDLHTGAEASLGEGRKSLFTLPHHSANIQGIGRSFPSITRSHIHRKGGAVYIGETWYMSFHPTDIRA